MPRTLKLLPTEILDEALDFNLYDEIGKLIPPSSGIWREISKRLSNQITPKHLWVMFHGNRYKLKNLYFEAKGLFIQEEIIEPKETEINTGSDINNTSTESVACSDLSYSIIEKKDVKSKNFPLLHTILTISAALWSKIIPSSLNYQDKRDHTRGYSVLRKGWTDIIYNAIWEQLRIPCAFVFKRGIISESPGCPYLKISALCHECHSNLSAHLLFKPKKTDENIILQVTASDTRGHAHIKKRRLAGQSRREIGKELTSTQAANWRRENANRCMLYGEPQPANLYSLEVLRKAKQEIRDEILIGGKCTDLVESFHNLNESVEFADIIKELCLNKFHLIYWTINQATIYKEMSHRERISISIDATGSLVQQVHKGNDYSGSIFLYQCVVSSKSAVVPIVQMLSEKHNANMIAYWLREWLRTRLPIPFEVITDFSLALMNAVSLAFNGMELSNYIDLCLQILKDAKDDNVHLPRTFLRIDIAHLINLVCRWKCFHSTQFKVKDFYVRCVGILSQCTTLEDFREILLSVLVVSQSKRSGRVKDMDFLTPCENREVFLMNRIKSYKIEQFVNKTTKTIEGDN